MEILSSEIPVSWRLSLGQCSSFAQMGLYEWPPGMDPTGHQLPCGRGGTAPISWAGWCGALRPLCLCAAQPDGHRLNMQRSTDVWPSAPHLHGCKKHLGCSLRPTTCHRSKTVLSQGPWTEAQVLNTVAPMRNLRHAVHRALVTRDRGGGGRGGKCWSWGVVSVIREAQEVPGCFV